MNRRGLWVMLGAALLVGLVSAGQAAAGGPPPQTGDNGACLACHANPELTYTFPSGQVWSLGVDADAFQTSIHGQQGLACTACHTDIEGYPHPPLEASNIRFYQLDQYRACAECHQEVYQRSLDSVHAQELAAGNWQAPVCTDCHGAHDTARAGQPRTRIPRTCSKCHAGIYTEYLDSVHGEALTEQDNPDVPTCVDCHGVHTQEDPRTGEFRLNSPQLCATCHADAVLMARYDISTNVFETYVADFHGTTVTLFERQTPDLPTNKPVCYDCHGVHNMKSPEDPASQVYQEQLLATCQKCHPDATANFQASWLSHYEPDIDQYPVVYFVDLFYQVLIPAVLGFMGVYVVVDLGGSLLRRLRRGEEEEEEAQHG
jgi:predicted CXXCH cytochrome family protein